MIKIFQIFYDESQRAELHPVVAHVDNSKATNEPCLENHVISKLIGMGMHDNCDYFGVLSWKFEKKRAVTITSVLERIEQDAGQNDVYAFDSSHTKPNVWVKAEQWHPGITSVAREAFERAGLQRYADQFDTVRTPNIYSNAFLARPLIYEIYVDTVLNPFMSALMQVESAKVDARYRAGKASKEHLLRATGYEYYTLMPFVCERLFPTFCAINKITKIKHLA